MNWKLIFDWLLIAFTVIALYSALTMDAHARDKYTAGYISNYDADTIKMLVWAWDEPPVFVEASIRLAGVDAPEIRGECDTEKVMAKEAKKFVADVLLEAEDVEIQILGKGKYGRLLANITYDGSDLATDLVDMGYARPYDGKLRMGWCDQEV